MNADQVWVGYRLGVGWVQTRCGPHLVYTQPTPSLHSFRVFKNQIFKYPSYSLSIPTSHLVYTQPTPSLCSVKFFKNQIYLTFIKYPTHSLSAPNPTPSLRSVRVFKNQIFKQSIYTHPTPSLYPTHTQSAFTQSFQKLNLPNFHQIPHKQSTSILHPPHTQSTPTSHLVYPTHTQSAFTHSLKKLNSPNFFQIPNTWSILINTHPKPSL